MHRPDPFPPDSHDALLLAIAGGEREALGRLYRLEGGRMLAVALRILRDRARAEDIVHDACVNIWTRAASFDPARGSARAWVYAVVRHLALNAVRDARHDVSDETPESAQAAIRSSLDAHRQQADALLARLDGERLGRCLAGLEPNRRDCVLHAYVDGCSHAEIAQRIGAPLGTVKAWIRRGLSALRECLS